MDTPDEMDLSSAKGYWLEWLDFKDRFLSYHIDSGLSEKSAKEQVDVLFSCMGRGAQSLQSYVSEHTQISQGTSGNTQHSSLENTIGALDEYFKPKDNHLHHAILLSRRTQLQGENNHQYIHAVYGLALRCDRWDECKRNEMILIQLLAGMRDQTFSIELQQDRTLTVKQTIHRMRTKDEVIADKVPDNTEQTDIEHRHVIVNPKEGKPFKGEIKEVHK